MYIIGNAGENMSVCRPHGVGPWRARTRFTVVYVYKGVRRRHCIDTEGSSQAIGRGYKQLNNGLRAEKSSKAVGELARGWQEL